jgi:hypothetical protein
MSIAQWSSHTTASPNAPGIALKARQQPPYGHGALSGVTEMRPESARSHGIKMNWLAQLLNELRRIRNVSPRAASEMQGVDQGPSSRRRGREPAEFGALQGASGQGYAT